MIFGLVSKKKYIKLKKEYEELKATHSALRWSDISKKINDSERELRLLKENQNLTNLLSEYKQKYADEVQKRLDLIDKIYK